MLWVNWDFEEAIFARWLAGSRGSANWGRLGQVASGERSLKGVRTEKEQEQMSACQLPQLLLRSFDYPAHRMLTSLHHLVLQMSCFQRGVLCKHLQLEIEPIFTLP